MRNAVLLVLLGALSGPVLAGEPVDRAVPNPERGGPTGDPTAPRPNPGPEPGARTCAAIDADAHALLDEARACTTDVGCATLSFDQLVGPSNCVSAFQCTGAVAGDLDRAAFLLAAAPLVTEKLACGECATAACMPPVEVVAVCREGRCEVQPR